MSVSLIMMSIISGLLITNMGTYLLSMAMRISLLNWGVNLIFGALGAVAAQQLLSGAYGPIVAGVSIVPVAVGSLVLAGLATWIAKKLANSAVNQ